jgi:hypothetical protein
MEHFTPKVHLTSYRKGWVLRYSIRGAAAPPGGTRPHGLPTKEIPLPFFRSTLPRERRLTFLVGNDTNQAPAELSTTR